MNTLETEKMLQFGAKKLAHCPQEIFDKERRTTRAINNHLIFELHEAAGD